MNKESMALEKGKLSREKLVFSNALSKEKVRNVKINTIEILPNRKTTVEH